MRVVLDTNVVMSGVFFGGFVIENLITATGDRRTPYYFRTEDGAEIDLLFERGGAIEMAIEIKRATAPSLSRGFQFAPWCCDPERPTWCAIALTGPCRAR